MSNSYERVRQWLTDHSKDIKIAGLVVLMFFVGFGSGRYSAENKLSTNRDYSTQVAPKEADKQQEVVPAKPEVLGEVTAGGTKVDTGECKIKGNISSSKEKIYHVPGGMFYDRTKAEECFNTEDQARAAGYRKSSR